MKPVIFTIEQDEETGTFTAFWDDPNGGGITTQAETLEELPAAIMEAIRCHFTNRPTPKEAAIHFHADPLLQVA